MFKKRKTTEVKKVIDVKFEVKEDFEEDREGCFTHLSEFLKGLQMGRREKCR